MSGLLTDYGMLTSKKKSSQSIEELERKKDLEVFKEDISELEMRKPSVWHGGYLKIKTRTSEDILIKIGSGGKTFDKVKEVVEKFKPEALKLV